MLPKYLTAKDGLPKRPPVRLAYIFRCGECGEALVRAATLWVCPKSLSHGRGIPDHVLIDRIKMAIEGLGYERMTAEGIWYIQRRIQAWIPKLREQAARHKKLVNIINNYRRGPDGPPS